MSNKPYSTLIPSARAAFLTVMGMNTTQLDDWYEQNVGYRLSVDAPDTTIAWRASMTAGMMFFKAQPLGVDQPGAEYVGRLLAHVIESPPDQVADATPYPQMQPFERQVALAIFYGLPF